MDRILEGKVVTERLLEIDRQYGNHVELNHRFSGLARGEHGVDLDFEGAIDDLLEEEAGQEVSEAGSLYLFLYGFIEYGYSTSNFAASQAGEVFAGAKVDLFRFAFDPFY